MRASTQALWRNRLTYCGAALGMLTALFIVSFLAIDLTSPQPSPYVGLFTYLVFPTVLFVSLAMMLVGIAVARRRFRRLNGRAVPAEYYPRIDLANARHRRVLSAAAAGAVLVIPLIGVLSYEGYHYTDSNDFCGRVCHTVMEPQFTAFQQSPHAHVGCAECHIGRGASWYVKSKLSGIRQVFAVALDTYPRPIPPAIQELRPATETCQQCHWPAKFYGDQLVTVEHFAEDEKNTHQQIRMLLKTGGSDPTTGPPSGIHWHMALGFSIEYVATDERLQEIPWVQTTDHATGRSRVFRSDGKPHIDPPPAGTRRTVDCMDCHNRPTHIFRSPERSADTALNVNPSLRNLPFAKKQLVEVLSRTYTSKAEAMQTIPRDLENYYREKHPQVAADRSGDVRGLMDIAAEIYAHTAFPDMTVNWRTYPDNIGHKIFPGCFRCHEGRHVSAEDKTISHECGTCHDFLKPVGEHGSNLVSTGGFVHPYKLEGVHARLRCDQCHSGGSAPQPSCTGCHSDIVAFRAGTLPIIQRFGVAPEPMADTVECEDCHDLSAPATVEAIDPRCMECHSDEPERFGGMLTAWKAESERLLESASASPAANTSEVRELLRTLRGAGLLHNPPAARKVLSALSSTAPPEETKSTRPE